MDDVDDASGEDRSSVDMDEAKAELDEKANVLGEEHVLPTVAADEEAVAKGGGGDFAKEGDEGGDDAAEDDVEDDVDPSMVPDDVLEPDE